MGEPLATDSQIKAIERYYNAPIEFAMTMDQASQILAVRDYVVAVANAARRANVPVSPDHELMVATWVLNTESLSDYVNAWGRRRFERKHHNGDPKPKRSEEFWQIFTYTVNITEMHPEKCW